jgi:lipopolysaccharide/colanic/teichoic acid biosynthesis glycosyltransferase
LSFTSATASGAAGSADDLLKRTFDVALAAGVLLLASPLLIAIAVIVAVTSPGGAIYQAWRIGRGRRPFCMFKFRTMRPDADQTGGLITCRDDPRVTSVGRWLRRTKLDELPELWNVIRGDMSLVGPRPENPRAVSLYSPSQRALLDARPGLTSPATIKYRHEESILERSPDLENQYFGLLQDKLALDLEYLRTRSFATDVKILLTTVAVLFR